MVSSLSAYRLRETASLFTSLTSFGDKFVVLRSKTTMPVAQFYIVPSDWATKSRNAQIEPLAHINVTSSGKKIFKTWQPELFNIKASKEVFIETFVPNLH